MAKLELELLKAQKVVLELQKAMIETAKEEANEQATQPELPRPQRYLTPDEAVLFLGLRSKSSLNYLHNSASDGPPFIRLTSRNRAYCLADLQLWADVRKATRK